jgi:hypothetical protein
MGKSTTFQWPWPESTGVTPVARQLVVVDGTATPAFKTASGDATVNSSGVITVKPIKWYTPKVIATEQSRENVAYGLLGTADEIPSVVLPESGLIIVGYAAQFKSSVSAAGKAAIFLSVNQLADSTGGSTLGEAGTFSTGFTRLGTFGQGLTKIEAAVSDVTTGQALSGSGTGGGFGVISAAAGTYNVSVQFKASSWSVTAKARKLRVATLGF